MNFAILFFGAVIGISSVIITCWLVQLRKIIFTGKFHAKEVSQKKEVLLGKDETSPDC